MAVTGGSPAMPEKPGRIPALPPCPKKPGRIPALQAGSPRHETG